MFDPKICIVFNGGAAGDFLTILILQQRYKLSIGSEYINNNGAVNLRHYNITKNIFNSLYFNRCFKNLTPIDSYFEYIKFIDYSYDTVNSHFCSKKIIDFFPSCKFYYIDDKAHCAATFTAFIKKRLDEDYSSLIEWVKNNPSDVKFSKIKYPNDEVVAKMLKKNMISSVNLWEDLKMSRIDINDIVDKSKCKILVKDIAQVEFDNTLFETTYDIWENKNKWFINLLKNSDNSQ